MRTRVIIWLLLAVATSWPAHAAIPETPRPRQITVADGLPSNRINGITEDQNGYLWIATSDGLARYDGIGFRIWRAEHGLRDNFVWAVHVDARNRVWIGTAKRAWRCSTPTASSSATSTAPITPSDRQRHGVGGDFHA